MLVKNNIPIYYTRNDEEEKKFFKFQGIKRVTDFLTEHEALKDSLSEPTRKTFNDLIDEL